MKVLMAFFLVLIMTFDGNANDIGQFTSVGYIGSNSGTLTFVQAQGVCLNQLGVGLLPNTNTPLFDESFKLCMREYLPFRDSASASGLGCPAQTITWGQCAGLSNPLETGNTASVGNINNVDDYTGFGNFMCIDGQMIFMSGGCSRTTDSCQEGEFTQWPVTSPAWADADPSTVFRDKYGEMRSNPQPNCAATLGSAISGDFVVQEITAPSDLSRYTSNSRAPLRCFDGQWSLEPPESAICHVVPMDCAARTMNYNGCNFNIPQTSHDEIFTNRIPNPLLSFGHVEAYCFDGQLDIKSQSCELSCDANPNATIWTSEITDPSSANFGTINNCSHDDIVGQNVIPPGTTLTIANNIEGRDGSVSMQCINGNLNTTDSTCKPSSCTELNSTAWSAAGLQCQHSSIQRPVEHGFKTSQPSTDIFNASGNAYYICSYGEFIQDPDIANNCETVPEPLCVHPSINIPEPNIEVGGTTPNPNPMDITCQDEFGRSGMIRVNQTCCSSNVFNQFTCYPLP